MKLYIVRHGEAVGKDVDPKRPLSENGKKETQKIAQQLKKAGITVELIYHSPKLRAKQTAEIIQSAISPQAQMIEKESLDPDASTDEVYGEIVQLNNDLMIVGHLPYLPKLIARLILGNEETVPINLSAGAVAVLKRESHEVWKLASLLTPAML